MFDVSPRIYWSISSQKIMEVHVWEWREGMRCMSALGYCDQASVLHVLRLQQQWPESRHSWTISRSLVLWASNNKSISNIQAIPVTTTVTIVDINWCVWLQFQLRKSANISRGMFQHCNLHIAAPTWISVAVHVHPTSDAAAEGGEVAGEWEVVLACTN